MRLNVPREHPDFGAVVACRCASEETQRDRGERLAAYAQIGALARLTFGDLIVRGRSPNARDQEQYRRCVEDARAFAESPEGWLMLSGASGCGKTHIAAAIVNRIIERGQPALFVVVPDLLDHLRAGYQPGAEIAYDDLFERIRNAPVLVLDDLGTQAPTPWAQEKLFQLINHRFNAQLPTVVTTNLAPEQFDDRLRTRLTDAALARVYSLETGHRAGNDALDVLDHPLIREMTFERFDVAGAPPAERRAQAHRERVPPGARVRGVTRRMAAADGRARRRQDAPRRRDRQLPPRPRRSPCASSSSTTCSTTSAAASAPTSRARRSRSSTS